MRALPKLAVALAAVCAPGLFGCKEVQRPVAAAIELRVRQIYDAGEWLKRVPVEIAIGLYARTRLEAFLDDLELPPDLRQRLLTRLRADDFVDELVPFLLFLRDMYETPTGRAAETFDDALRQRFEPGDAIPGMEHSMFAWQQAEPSPPSLPALEPEIVRQLLTLYDVLYLRDPARAAGLVDRLACESRVEAGALQAATQQASPAVRGLLRAFESELGSQAEVGAAIGGVLEDEGRLEAATAALIRLLDQTVCRNYRFFAARAFRGRQLGSWMKRELARPAGGDLWAFLRHAQDERRYGGLIVVDGLQGHLLRALAAGRPDDPFITAIAAEQRAGGGAPPTARSLQSAPDQRTQFLQAFAKNGFDDPRYLPFFRARLLDPHTHWLPVGVSTTPTISVRNIPIALTGAAVAGSQATGLPNFHFVDRHFRKDGVQHGRAYYFFGSDAVELVPLARAAGMRTLFERSPHLGSLSCHAQYDERAHFGIDALLNLALGEAVRDFGERLCAAELERRAETELTLRGLRARLLERETELGAAPTWWSPGGQLARGPERELAERWIDEIAMLEQRTLPELWVAYDPWPDHFAHFKGPFADEILSPSGELARLDYWLGRWTRAYARAGVAARAVFGLAGDHGLAPVFHLVDPEVEVFDALRNEGTDFRVVKISSDEGEGPKLTNPFDPPTMRGIDVVVASTAGGNFMLDLFLDQEARFGLQPLASDLAALRPLAQPEAPPVDLLEEISVRLGSSLDYLAAREEPCDPEGGAVRLMGARAGGMARAVVTRRGDRLHYRWEGADLLDTDRLSPYEVVDEGMRSRHRFLRERCLSAAVEAPESWCDRSEWRELTSFTSRPDSVVQIGHLYDTGLAGTVNLFPARGIGFNSVVPGRHAGESFHEKDAMVALWGAPLRERDATTPLRSAVNGALPMAIHRHVTGEATVAGRDGWAYLPVPEDWWRKPAHRSDAR